ncbi:MAG: penicillin-binding protein activator LpoB [Verrucomicrobiae bacterium]|nr:penicillin-binding protein activator LpoB [Verrucomicrobiae bacterium]
MKALLQFMTVLFAALFSAGCASDQPPPPPQYVDPGAQGTVAGTGIESQDLLAATDKMVRLILNTPRLQARKGSETPVIGLLPVENRTRFAIDKEIFLTRMKALLNDKSQGQVRFVARDRMDAIKKEKALKDQGEVTGGARRKPFGIDFFLTGELSSLSTSTSRGKSEYMLFTFRLIDAETSEEIWEGMHELKKEGAEDAVYR